MCVYRVTELPVWSLKSVYSWVTAELNKYKNGLCDKILLLTKSLDQNFSSKANGSVPNQEIPLIYGTQKSVTLFTTARHLFLSSTKSIQLTLSFSCLCKIHFNFILHSNFPI